MRVTHTPALLRSLAIAAVLGVLAIAAQRSDVAVLIAPFVVHLAWAWAVRLRGEPEVEVSAKAVVVPEGESVPLVAGVVQAWPSSLVTVQWPVWPGIAVEPDAGTVLDAVAPGGSRVAVQPERWGRYDVGPGSVAVADLSGSWRAWARMPRVQITVRPASSTLEGGSGVAHPIGMVGMHRSRHRGDGSDLADVREFRPGDRLRRINWRVTSRLGKVHVNSTLTERDTDVLIVVDTLLEVDASDSRAATCLDATVRAVAAISRHYVGFGDRVAVHDLGRRIGHVRSGTGPRQARVVLGVLSRANRSVQDWDLLRPVGTVTSGMLVFFCSPLLEREAQDELVRLRRMGAEVIGVDTLPEGVGRFEDIAVFRRDTFLGEAWMMRRMERDDAIERLRGIGIPVTPWRGTSSLASVLLSMEAARSAPRRVLGR